VVSEQTREEDERLREELRRVDLNKLKKILKSLLRTTRKKKDS
jgi:predicted transposase YbfD/YdcC